MRLLFFLLFLVNKFNYYSQQSIETILDSYKKDKDLSHASYGFCILEASTGKVIKEYNAELGLVPASTMKIVTTSAALGILGKDYTYKTNFYTLLTKDSVSGRVYTDLYIKGSGDPSFNSSYFYDDDSSFISAIVSKLYAKRLKKINSSVHVDISVFDNEIPGTWIWSDIGNYFGAGANGLSYRDNKFSVFFNTGALKTEAVLQTIKPSYFEKKGIIKQAKVIALGTEDNAFVYGDPDSFDRKILGTIPPNKKNYEIEAQMPKPGQYFADALSQELKAKQMADTGVAVFISEGSIWRNPKIKEELTYIHQSPKLEKIVYFTNVKSDNHYAESLLNTLGAVTSGKQGTTGNGIEAVTKFWKDRGVDVSGLHMADGSGLSRANTITPKVQAAILSKIYRDSLMYPSFNASLPVAGKNGSMINIGKGTFAENNMRAKTGYINRARGYCGYVKTKSGKELAFSVLFNNYDCSAKEMKLKIEKLLVALTEL